MLIITTGGKAIAYDRIVQTIHLLTNSSLGQPTDLWVPATSKIPPSSSSQYSFGIMKVIPKIFLELEIDLYFKSFENIIEYKEGANYLFGINENWEDKVTIGNGTSKGIEILTRKNFGKVNAMINYTLAKSERKFDDINNGRKFPFKYDRRHDLSCNFTYNFSPNRKFTTLFVFNTGNAITLPVATVQGMLPPNWQFHRSDDHIYHVSHQSLILERNNMRIPAYHRLDISYQSTKKLKNGNSRSWIWSIYNVYNRLNPYFIYQNKGTLQQYAFFPIIPSVTYKLEF